MPDLERIKRPDCEKAHYFTAGVCSSKGCGGLHLIAHRINDQPICEIVIGRAAVGGLFN